jgi:hypothetical protein
LLIVPARARAADTISTGGPFPVCYDLKMQSQLKQDRPAIVSPRLAFATLILVVLGAAGCAARSRQTVSTNAASLPGKDDCIWVLYVDRWETIDPSTLLVYTANNNYFLVKLAQPVANLNNHDAVAFYAGNHDDRVCGSGTDLLVRTTDALRDPIMTIRSIKASQARQYQKMIAPTTATAAATTKQSARRRKPAPANGTPAQSTDTSAQPTDTTTQPSGTATPPTGTTAQPAAGP